MVTMEDKKNSGPPPEDLDAAVRMAQFRFGMIAPVVQGRVPDASNTAYFKRITEEPIRLPDGREVRYEWKTPERWYYLFQKGGFDELMPKPRSDRGVPRALPDTAIEEIYRLRKEYPRLNATQIHTRLVQGSFIPATVSVDTVQRFIRKNGLGRGCAGPGVKDRRAFEEDAFGKMWQADTCHFCHIRDSSDGSCHMVYLMVIIDDHSRLIVGCGMFYEDSAANFQRVLKEAVSTYGIPSKLYCDHGAPYENTQLSLICGSIGTVLIHAPVRDGAAKAKVERNFRSMNEGLLYGLDLENIHGLPEFNAILKDYVRRYNTRPHSGIGCAPFDRYQATKGRMRIPKSREWLDECFLNRTTRKVRRDATISIGGESYDVPMQFISQKVEIRFSPGDMSSAFILHDGKRFPIHTTDRNANCRAKRENPASIDYSKIGG